MLENEAHWHHLFRKVIVDNFLPHALASLLLFPT